LIYYLDTSVVVAALTKEAKTADVQAWLGSRASDDDLLVSDWVTTEFAAALSIKLRSGQIDAAVRAQALSGYGVLRGNSLTTLTIAPEQFATAAQFANQYSLGLRAGDSLHLAIAAEHGATLCTLDRRLSGAGPALGVPTLLV
jgi:predicted nucleic acid-binding protein